MRTTTVVIGAGHSGLAMSRCLSDRSIDHVVLERSEIANSWRTRAVGLASAAHAELAVPASRPRLRRRRPRRLHDHARGRRLHRGVCQGDRRAGADRHDGDVGATYRRRVPVTTDEGEWQCRHVVLATGAFNRPHRTRISRAMPSRPWSRR